MIGNGKFSEYLTDIVRGVYPDKSPMFAFGEKTTTGADSGLIWPNGAFNVTPETPVSIEAVSSTAQDAAAGTGIRQVEVHYIDTNWEEQEEYLALTGTTPAVMAATDVRFIQYVHLDKVGSDKAANGNITFRVAGGGTTYDYIAAGETISNSSARMVPAGKRLLIYAAVSGAVSGTAAAQCKIRIAGSEIRGHQYINPVILIPYSSLGFQDSSFGMNFQLPIVVHEKTIVGMTFESDKAATVSGTWFGVIENSDTFTVHSGP